MYNFLLQKSYGQSSFFFWSTRHLVNRYSTKICSSPCCHAPTPLNDQIGDISPLWQKFSSIWPFYEGLYSIWQVLFTLVQTLINVNGQILDKKSCHLVTLPSGRPPIDCRRSSISILFQSVCGKRQGGGKGNLRYERYKCETIFDTFQFYLFVK